MASTVTVCCKMPNGLIIDHEGKSARLNGANHSELIGGYGMTEVDKELWEAWKAKFHDNSLIKNEIVFAQATKASAKKAAEEREEINSGFERLSAEKPTPGVDERTED